MKRRKISKEYEEPKTEEFKLDEFLSELSSYQKLPAERRKTADEVNLKYLKSLLKKERVKHLEQLLRKYFHIEPPKNIFQKTPFKEDMIKEMVPVLNRILEKRNIRELNFGRDIRLIPMCGILVPREIILLILSYLHFSYETVCNLGCSNSSFYILMLSNWNSDVNISVHNLRKISSFILKSMRHMTLILPRKMFYEFHNKEFSKEDFEYLFRSITPNRILSLTIKRTFHPTSTDAALDPPSYRNLHGFFRELAKPHETDGFLVTGFPNCRTFSIPTCSMHIHEDGQQYSRRRLEESILVEDKFDFNSEELSHLLPNIEILYCQQYLEEQLRTENVFETSLSYLKNVKELHFTTKKGEFISHSDTFTKVFNSQSSSQLEGLEVGIHSDIRSLKKSANEEQWNYMRNVNLGIFFSNVSKDQIKSLRRLSFSHSYCTSTSPLKELKFLSKLSELRSISIRYNGLNGYFPDIRDDRNVCKVFRSLRSVSKIELFDPAHVIVKEAIKLSNLKHLQLTFSTSRDLFIYFSYSNNRSSEESFYEKEMRFIFNKLPPRLETIDILAYSRRRSNDRSSDRTIYDSNSYLEIKPLSTTICQLIYKKKFGRVFFYWLNRDRSEDKKKKNYYEDFLLNDFSRHFKLMSKSSYDEMKEKKEKKIGVVEINVFCNEKRKRNYWDKIRKILVPVRDGMNLRMTKQGNDDLVLDGSFLLCEGETNWVKCERRCFTVDD